MSIEKEKEAFLNLGRKMAHLQGWKGRQIGWKIFTVHSV